MPVVVTSTAQAAAALAGEQVGTLFPADGPPSRRPAVLAALRQPPARPAAARRGRGARRPRAARLAAGRRASPASPATSSPTTRSSWSGPDGVVVARGLVAYDARELPAAARPQDRRPRAGVPPRGRAPRRDGAGRAAGPAAERLRGVTIRPIRELGDPVLRTPADEVRAFDGWLAALVRDLVETVDHPGRAGLAAPQIGVSVRAFSYNIDGVIGHMVNPVIVELSEETQDGDEGCLSVPGIWAPTVRAMHAVVEGFDVDGKPLRLEGDGPDGALPAARGRPPRRQGLPRPADRRRPQVRPAARCAPLTMLPRPVTLAGDARHPRAAARRPPRRARRGRVRRPALGALVHLRAVPGDDAGGHRGQARPRRGGRCRSPSGAPTPARWSGMTTLPERRGRGAAAGDRCHLDRRARRSGTGVNAESKLLLLTHAFEVLGCLAVEFRTHWHNQQSRTAIAAAGRQAGRRAAQPPADCRTARCATRSSSRSSTPSGPPSATGSGTALAQAHRRLAKPCSPGSGLAAYPRDPRVRRRRPAADRCRRAACAGGRPGAAHPAHRRQGRRARRDGRRAGRAHRRGAGRQRRRRRGRRRRRHARSRCSTGCGWTPAASPASPTRCAQLVALPDPVGDVVRGSRLPNGLQLRQVRVPLGRGRASSTRPAPT